MSLRAPSPDRLINVIDVFTLDPDDTFLFVTIDPRQRVGKVISVSWNIFDVEIKVIEDVKPLMLPV